MSSNAIPAQCPYSSDTSATGEAVKLRLMQASDLPLMHAWLQREHVRAWWGRERLETLASVENKYLPRVRGETHVTPFIAMVDGMPIGYCQSYRVAADEFWQDETNTGARGCDQFLGEVQLLGQGLGTRLVRALVHTLFDDVAVTKIQTGPSPANARAIRCYEKAGFRPLKVVATPDGEALLMLQMRVNISAQARPRPGTAIGPAA